MRGRTVAVLVAITLLLGASACGRGGDAPKPATKSFPSGASSSPGGIEVKSSAFRNNASIPEKHSCKGENTPPPLQWSGVPDGTRSVAVVVTDPDAPNGVFVHWIVVGLPGRATGSLSTSNPPAGATVVKNSADQAGYTGMCPPAGQQHKYNFEVFALGRVVTLPDDMSPVDKVKALRAAATKSGKLTGSFRA